MNKHTPGPWHIQKYNKDKLFINAENAQIAHILHTETCGLISMPEQRTANAALIAAAPELLEALVEISHALADGSLKFTRPRQSDSDPYHKANVLMCAAIEKATA